MERDKGAGRKKRFAELAVNSRSQNAYYFTDFMTAAEAAEAYQASVGSEITIYGGYEHADRVMVRFGDPEMFGYEQEFPIRVLRIAPRAEKFSEDLTHRDFLGTLMGLGIERDVIGDILVKGNTAYVLLADRMAEYVEENLLTVKHTAVSVEGLDAFPTDASPEYAEEELIVASLRLDGILSKLYHLSREKTKQLFAKEQVLIAGRPVLQASVIPKDGDVISVRGYGKFIYDGELRATKKGNTVVSVRRYV